MGETVQAKACWGYEGRKQQDSIRAGLPALFSMTVSSETYNVCVHIGSMRLLTAGLWRPPSKFPKDPGKTVLWHTWNPFPIPVDSLGFEQHFSNVRMH